MLRISVLIRSNARFLSSSTSVMFCACAALFAHSVCSDAFSSSACLAFSSSFLSLSDRAFVCASSWLSVSSISSSLARSCFSRLSCCFLLSSKRADTSSSDCSQAAISAWCLTCAAIRTSRSRSLVARSPLICSKSSVDIALSPATKSEELAASAPGCSPFIPLLPPDTKPRLFNIALLCLSVHLRSALLTLFCRVEVGGGT